MSEVLGLIDSLEASILEGKRIPMTNKIIIEEDRILHILDKVRLVIKSDADIVKTAVDRTTRNNGVMPLQRTIIESQQQGVPVSENSLSLASEEADKIRYGANSYADNVLANLQLIVAKMQTNLVKLEQNIESGRDVLDKKKDMIQTEIEPEVENYE
jgi:hypothetical protein